MHANQPRLSLSLSLSLSRGTGLTDGLAVAALDDADDLGGGLRGHVVLQGGEFLDPEVRQDVQARARELAHLWRAVVVGYE
jgi:hypothetical protein